MPENKEKALTLQGVNQPSDFLRAVAQRQQTTQ